MSLGGRTSEPQFMQTRPVTANPLELQKLQVGFATLGDNILLLRMGTEKRLAAVQREIHLEASKPIEIIPKP